MTQKVQNDRKTVKKLDVFFKQILIEILEILIKIR